MANSSTLQPSDSFRAFGAALKTFRERALLTQVQLAEREILVMSRSAWCRDSAAA